LKQKSLKAQHANLAILKKNLVVQKKKTAHLKEVKSTALKVANKANAKRKTQAAAHKTKVDAELAVH